MGSLVNSGWVKLWREILSKAIWSSSSPEQKTVLITVLLLANHERNEWIWKGEKYSCEAGQLITSLRSLQEACGTGVTMQNVRTALVKFEKLGFLTNESTKTGRLITIVNWAKYQGEGGEANKATNKALTKHSQSTNKALTPNKNDKNDKNERMKEVCVTAEPSTSANTHTIPTLKDVTRVAAQLGQAMTKEEAQRFIDYNTALGWKMEWKYALKRWFDHHVEKQKEQANKWGNDPDQRKEYGGEIKWEC